MSLNHDKIATAIQASTGEVFTTMLGLEMEPGETYVQSVPPSQSEGVVSLIGLVGDWVGTGKITCSA
jgi:CheY-specific phosphatase CheX